jgi:hypothetical protein
MSQSRHGLSLVQKCSTLESNDQKVIASNQELSLDSLVIGLKEGVIYCL